MPHLTISYQKGSSRPLHGLTFFFDFSDIPDAKPQRSRNHVHFTEQVYEESNDIGTKFQVKAAAADSTPIPLPSITLTRGARHMELLPAGRGLVVLRGDIAHKNLWLIDLQTGAEKQLTNLPSDFDVRDFDISPDGHEVVLERVQERSDVVLLDLPQS